MEGFDGKMHESVCEEEVGPECIITKTLTDQS